MRRKSPPTAFTLIELLVTIAVIAVLASFLLPSLVAAKEKGRSAFCLNNLRQLQMASFIYAGDNNGVFPSSLAEQDRSWVEGIMAYEPRPGGDDNYIIGWEIFYKFWSTNTALLIDPKHSTLGAYTKNSRIYKCPSDRSYVVIKQTKHPRARSYSLNGFINPELINGSWVDWERNWGYRVLKSLSDTQPAPAHTFTYIDEHEDTVRRSEFYLSPRHPDFWWHLPASRHTGAGTLAFADGHVELKKWLDPRTRAPVTRLQHLPSVTPGNKDHEWILKRATSGQHGAFQ